MNITGCEKIGTFIPELIIAGSNIPVSVCHVTIAQTEKEVTLKKGTVLALNSSGKCVVYSGAEGTKPAYILAEDVTTSTTADVTGEAFQSGEFVENNLITGESYTLTANDKETLRNAGIFLTKAMV